MEVYYIFVKNNTTSRKRLWDLQQGTTHYSRSFYKIETIFIKYHREVWSLDQLWKSQIFPGATQAQWKTSKMIFKVIRL